LAPTLHLRLLRLLRALSGRLHSSPLLPVRPLGIRGRALLSLPGVRVAGLRSHELREPDLSDGQGKLVSQGVSRAKERRGVADQLVGLSERAAKAASYRRQQLEQHPQQSVE